MTDLTLTPDERAQILASRAGLADPWAVVIRDGPPQVLADTLRDVEAQGLTVWSVLPNGVNRWTVIARRTGAL